VVFVIWFVEHFKRYLTLNFVLFMIIYFHKFVSNLSLMNLSLEFRDTLTHALTMKCFIISHKNSTFSYCSQSQSPFTITHCPNTPIILTVSHRDFTRNFWEKFIKKLLFFYFEGFLCLSAEQIAERPQYDWKASLFS
jgi:hypothetical protein